MIIVRKQDVHLAPSLCEAEMLDLMGRVLAVPYSKGVYDVAKTKTLIGSCVKDGHESVLEHCNISLDCITTIGTYKGYTRHRHCAFTIESTIFSKYGEDLEVIVSEPLRRAEFEALSAIHELYKKKNQRTGRDLLPQCCAARMIMTTNVRQWRSIIALRSDPAENPLTQELRDLMWRALNSEYPFFFPFNPTGQDDNPMYIRNAWGAHKYATLTKEYEEW